MLHYGAAAQALFDIDANNPADAALTALADISTNDIHPTGTNMTEGLAEYGLEYTGSTLVCRSETVIRHYYTVTNQNAFALVKDSISINGESVRYKERNNEIYFEIKNIAAADLDTDYTLTIGDKAYPYSVMDYVSRALQAIDNSNALWKLVTALFRYNQAANAFFGR